MDQVTPYLDQSYTFLQSGFDGVNTTIGLLIALIVTMMMKDWKQLWGTALLGTVFFFIVQTLQPVLAGRPFRLPELLTLEFWIQVLATFVGMAVVVTVFFFVKKNVLKAA